MAKHETYYATVRAFKKEMEKKRERLMDSFVSMKNPNSQFAEAHALNIDMLDEVLQVVRKYEALA